MQEWHDTLKITESLRPMSVRSELQPSNIDILSPHLDDAAFSSWHQIEKLGSRVLTIFTGIPDDPTPSKWDLSTGFTSSHDVMNARIQEDEQALAIASTEALNLNFLEREYRDTPPSVAEIADRVESMSSRDALFIAAAGIGRYGRIHVDHIITRKVGLELLNRGQNVNFFVDIPYMLPVLRMSHWPERLPVERIKQEFDLDVEVEPVELTGDEQRRKQEASRTYKTQFTRTNRAAFGALSRDSAYRWEALIRPK